MTTGDVAQRRAVLHPAARVGLLGLAVGAAWLVVSLFSGGQGASAATGDDEGLLGSLLGKTGQTVQTVVQTTTAPVPQVLEPVEKVVAPVKQAVAPVVTAVAAAPQAAASSTPVANVVKSVPTVVTTTVRSAAEVVRSAPQTVATATAAVPEVLAVVPAALDELEVSAIAEPVTRLLDGVVNESVGGVPVVGGVVTDLLGAEPTGDLLAPVTGGVDGVVDTVVGDVVSPVVDTVVEPGGGALVPLPERPVHVITPALPSGASAASLVPAAPGSALPVFADAVRTGAAASVASGGTIPAQAPDGGSVPPAAPAAPAPTGGQSSSAGGSGASGASMISDAASAAFLHEATASLALNTVRDELPSSPVFDTDSTPD